MTFALDHVFGREDVLALEATVLVVGAGAMGFLWAQPNGVTALVGLAWNGPRFALPHDLGRRGDFQALLLPVVATNVYAVQHDHLSRIWEYHIIYGRLVKRNITYMIYITRIRENEYGDKTQAPFMGGAGEAVP